MGDWRSFKYDVAETAGNEGGKLVLVEDTVAVVHIGKLILDSKGCPLDPQVYEFGEEGVAIYHAEKIVVEKATGQGQAALVGQKVYWSGVYGDPVTVVKTSGQYWIGIVAQPAAADVATVVIDLKGDKATLLE